MSAPINNGGFAFPYGQISELTGQPIHGCFSTGMTLRDWFAGMALQGRLAAISTAESAASLSASANECGTDVVTSLAMSCYQLADAMVKEKEAAQ